MTFPIVNLTRRIRWVRRIFAETETRDCRSAIVCGKRIVRWLFRTLPRLGVYATVNDMADPGTPKAIIANRAPKDRRDAAMLHCVAGKLTMGQEAFDSVGKSLPVTSAVDRQARNYLENYVGGFGSYLADFC